MLGTLRVRDFRLGFGGRFRRRSNAGSFRLGGRSLGHANVDQRARLAFEFLHGFGQTVAATLIDCLEQRVQHGAELLVLPIDPVDLRELTFDLGEAVRDLGLVLFDLAQLVADAALDRAHQVDQTLAVRRALFVDLAEVLYRVRHALAQFLDTAHGKPIPA